MSNYSETHTHIASLEPVALWQNFVTLNAIPRPSKQEEKVTGFMRQFGESLNLKTTVDSAGNVLIQKPATVGMEDRQTIVLQAHIDMVHEKTTGHVFDFTTQGIQMLCKGDWIQADNTTLGADNGIGVAAIMAILASTEIAHPTIEALFTTDEEMGMGGAKQLAAGALTGAILLNLDTEDDDELTIGCAGGVDVTASGSYIDQAMPDDYQLYTLTVAGLNGGHSGVEIHKGRANANVLMARVLQQLLTKISLRVSSINGGGARNAIPRECASVIAVPNNALEQFEAELLLCATTMQAEYLAVDPGLTITHVQCASESVMVMSTEDQAQFLQALLQCPDSVYRMSPDIEGLVQSSNNIARVQLGGGSYAVGCLTRSSVEAEKLEQVTIITTAFEGIGATVVLSAPYAGWEPKPTAPIVQIMRKVYMELFTEEPKVNAIHAGLECGVLGQHYPNMQMISFGPNIRDAHLPTERVQISSVQKFWKYFLVVLQKIPTV